MRTEYRTYFFRTIKQKQLNQHIKIIAFLNESITYFLLSIQKRNKIQNRSFCDQQIFKWHQKTREFCRNKWFGLSFSFRLAFIHKLVQVINNFDEKNNVLLLFIKILDVPNSMSRFRFWFLMQIITTN